VALEPAVLAGFGLKPLGPDGSGVTIAECMSLLATSWAGRGGGRGAAPAAPAAEAGVPEPGLGVPEPEPEAV